MLHADTSNLDVYQRILNTNGGSIWNNATETRHPKNDQAQC